MSNKITNAVSNFLHNLKTNKFDSETKWGLFIAGGASLIFLLVLFVIPTDLYKFAQRAPLEANVIGGALIVLGFLFVLIGAVQEWVSGLIVWIILLAFGVAISCGFNFDYFGIK